MDLRHFFENMVRREETASAFLATLLDFDPVFRAAFLSEATDDPSLDAGGPWRVSVEEGRVDVSLESDAARVLIEDKIAAGARQQGQLLRYYLRAVDEVPDKRIVALYLAPRDMGRAEVDRVARDATFSERGADLARHISWAAVARIIDGLPEGDATWFARTGIREIERAIRQADRDKYLLTGDRAVVRDIVDHAYEALAQRHPEVRLGRWMGADFEQVLTYGAAVTLWLDAVFPVDPAPPHEAVGVVRPDGVHIVVRSAFKLAGKSRREPDLQRAWDRLRVDGRADVPGIGVHALRPDGWFVHEAPAAGGAAEAADELARVGSAVLEFLRSTFALGAD